MAGKKFSEVDYDAWLIGQADKDCPDYDCDEQYEILKNWLEKTDEEMKEVDLESEWESYLSWQEDCRAEALAEARAEAKIARYESYAD